MIPISAVDCLPVPDWRDWVSTLDYNTHMHFFSEFFFGPPFQPFSPPHLIALGLILLVNLGILWRGSSLSGSARRAGRYTLVGLLLFSQLTWLAWVISIGKASLQTMLPLHLCSLMTWVSVAMLLTGSQTLFELSYFLGGGGALFALLTPEIGLYNFPHFVFFQTLTGHGVLLTSQIFMAAAEGRRPRPRSVLRVFAVLNLYLPVAAVVNALTGANYMFLAYKPDFPSLLDLLGPWPWYILSVEALTLVVLVLMDLPMKTKSRQRPRKPDQAA